jgi:aspartyl-tRNA(Asn)/glutamyl-tRNA(Gln) amidotransferase subunit B
MGWPAPRDLAGGDRHGYEVVIGLEVHLALRTRTKLFCACPTGDVAPAPDAAGPDADPAGGVAGPAPTGGGAGDRPNRHVCPVCLGLPGSLPVANARALELAVRFAAALGCTVPPVTVFARKHYGYPDAPKNYQLSQHDRPVGLGGAIELAGGRRIGLVRCHLEEDAGRLIHPTYADHSLVDLDRAGAPLVELVTAPDLRSGEEARAFLEEVRSIARALDVSDATPEEGRMRADVNVSVRRPGGPLGTKVEVKNLNSFKSVQAAIESETLRQTRLLDAGRTVSQETRGWNEGGQKSYVLRSKEEAADYRYLDDPDLPPILLSAAWLARVLAATPETPAARRRRYRAEGLKPDDADRLAADIDLARSFDALRTAAAGTAAAPQSLANWLLVEVAGWAHASGRTVAAANLVEPRRAADLAALVALAEAGDISGPTAKALLPEVLAGADPRALVVARGLRQVSDEGALARWVDDAIAAHAEVAAGAREQPKAVNFLMGQVMKASRGQARPEAVRALLLRRLGLDGD